MKARTFSTAFCIRRDLAALVAHARCGVMTQFLALRSGLLAGGGSTDRTSIPAPARRPEFKAIARASSSTSWPRLVFSRKALGFIQDKRRALTICFVSCVNGQWRLKTSLSRKRVSKSKRFTDPSDSRGPELAGVRPVTASTLMPRLIAIRATAVPIRPSPMIPIVKPSSSISGRSQ